MLKTPDTGDIVILDFDPQLGHEQAGKRPALVLSPKQFNAIAGVAFVIPVTNQSKGYPFEVQVTGTRKTTGVVLTDQLKSLDWKARRMKVVDSVDAHCLKQTRQLLQTILQF